ncbi:MAG TPA: hypothetical protein VG759_06410 [Candidatus Angelobacter sp.]|jgi:hypothetical protein|nr:hypothetical protein [Candidatus Angelobacter sp.]
MKKFNILIVFGVLLLGTTMLSAQASRTWVSGVGDDANPCSRTAPCKTFAGAISRTAAGGEIDALDPAGYGAVTITKGITIDGGGGQVASVLVSGTNGIVVQAGPSDVVILRNLRINGIGTGINGIRFLAGKALIVDKCEIFGFTTNGVDIALGSSGQAWVTNTNIQNIGGTGVAATTTAGVVTVGIENVRVELSNKGFESGNHSRVTVNNSLVQNAASIGGQADGDAILTANASDFDLSGTGLQAGPGGGTVLASNNQVAYNSTGFFNNGGTAFQTYGNNRLHDNTTPTNGAITAAPAVQ